MKERATAAAIAYAGRVGMALCEPVPGGFHAVDGERDVFVVVTARKSTGEAAVTLTARRHAQREERRLDHIIVRVLSADRALLRHHRDVPTE
ncbi:MAG: hypothetical protein Q7J82_06695 [Coriobacteriia bacterium]|nr:hypothetical protein [Coriobacteriia bacterium]